MEKGIGEQKIIFENIYNGDYVISNENNKIGAISPT
jgi:hypothetical protein